MKRKVIAVLLTSLMAFSLAACGGGGDSGDSGSSDSGSSSGNSDAIRLVNGKIEINSQLKKLAEKIGRAHV